MLLPLALLLLLVTLLISFAGPSLFLLEVASFADNESVVGFLVFGGGISGVLLPLALLLLLVTLLISFAGPSLLFLELGSFAEDEFVAVVVSFLLLGAVFFSMEEYVFFVEDGCCFVVPLLLLPLPLWLLDCVFLGVVGVGMVCLTVNDLSCSA